MKRYRVATIGLLILFACALACSDVEDPGCDLWLSSAVVQGLAKTPAGDPVVGCELQVRVDRTGPCDDPDAYGGGMNTVTDENGAYRVTLQLGNQSGVMCVMVIDEDSGATANGQVEFVGGCGDERPPQELNLDLVVQ